MVDYIARDDVALLQINNPPVNALSHRARVALKDGLKKAGQDPHIKSIVISGKENFIAGVDIKEFASGSTADPTKRRLGAMKPTILEVSLLCNLIESSGKPVVAAIKGLAIGGGHEIAISCHYRIAHEKSKFAFPEVNIGIVPSAGGTQRFPRLVGLKTALDLIPSGRHIGAAQAFKLGIVDKVVRGDVVEEAVKFAQSIAGEPLLDRRTSERSVMGTENVVDLRDGTNPFLIRVELIEIISAALKLAMKEKKGMIAPIHCIKAVMGSLLPFEQGMQVEAAEADIVFTSGQTEALQYAFFAQRAASKWLLPCGASFKTVKGRPIRNAAVIGAGTMGTGIAMAMLNAGIPVTLVEQDRKFMDKGVSLLKLLYAGSVSLRKITQDECDAILSKLTTAVGYKSLTNVDLVIVAVCENMALKKQIFAELDRICPSETFLWSNTSAVDIDEIASATRRPDKVLGTHFFVPAYHMKLLGNVRGKLTSAETIASAQMFGTRIGQLWLLGYGWPRHTGGPMYYANMVGLDKIYNRICHYNELHKHSAHWQPSLLLKKLVASKTPMKDWVEVAQASSKL
ncbi:hypothetical protein CAPTEDRAFT_211159 [Capitella teleta]|uniref:Peroxisomal bifunctional enzyme n=1 Tax=Capitella teleta TaxID=283909 RepID=R7UAQ8_CAPTE|nr:hypothetical protein CAPTEDRAFT_211159 [Capitella teleta]|eukprot:ELU03221.1 hypothetical protein CAPTEDRAFT_211159 [Capitella teleta]